MNLSNLLGNLQLPGSYQPTLHHSLFQRYQQQPLFQRFRPIKTHLSEFQVQFGRIQFHSLQLQMLLQQVRHHPQLFPLLHQVWKLCVLELSSVDAATQTKTTLMQNILNLGLVNFRLYHYYGKKQLGRGEYFTFQRVTFPRC